MLFKNETKIRNPQLPLPLKWWQKMTKVLKNRHNVCNYEGK